jgi:hypothetical protein
MALIPLPLLIDCAKYELNTIEQKDVVFLTCWGFEQNVMYPV